MTTPAPFEEFQQIAELLLEVRGEVNGLVNGERALAQKLGRLAALVTRGLDQTESITRQAARLAQAAQQTLAARTADGDTVRAELDALRVQARAALTRPHTGGA